MKSLIFLGALLLLPFNSYCCTCIGKASIVSALKKADVVFLGTVYSKNIVAFSDTIIEGVTVDIIIGQYTFIVGFSFKGLTKVDTITVFTGLGDGDCGFPFELGKNYIVYAYCETKRYRGGPDVEPFLFTDVCTRTRLASDTNELEQLRLHTRTK